MEVGCIFVAIVARASLHHARIACGPVSQQHFCQSLPGPCCRLSLPSTRTRLRLHMPSSNGPSVAGRLSTAAKLIHMHVLLLLPLHPRPCAASSSVRHFHTRPLDLEKHLNIIIFASIQRDPATSHCSMRNIYTCPSTVASKHRNSRSHYSLESFRMNKVAPHAHLLQHLHQHTAFRQTMRTDPSPTSMQPLRVQTEEGVSKQLHRK